MLVEEWGCIGFEWFSHDIVSFEFEKGLVMIHNL